MARTKKTTEKLFDVYKVDRRNGDMKKLGDATGKNNKDAFENFWNENGWRYRSKKGMWAVIEYNIIPKSRFVI